jgi:predicted pyridoxine 5'-phosphate oxidase superfamily flavin-nucleotide-binding protein
MGRLTFARGGQAAGEHRPDPPRPGSDGERILQRRYGSAERAERFYRTQVLDHLNVRMRDFVAGMGMFFIATADAGGHCDASIRVGEPGFVRSPDAHTLVYPEFRGNGVKASLGNLVENSRIGMLFVDFEVDLIGLHVNGDATIVDPPAMAALGLPPEWLDRDATRRGSRRPEHYVQIHVREAYVHCSKHLPRLVPVPRQVNWGTDDGRRKGGDYFHVASVADRVAP